MGRLANVLLSHAVAVACLIAAATPCYPQQGGERGGGAGMASFTRGVYLLENGRADQAIEPLEEAWRVSQHAPAVGARLAEAYYAVRDLSRAEKIADDVLAADPDREDVLQLKARLCYARRDVPAAIANLERVRELSPGSFETERLLASLYTETGDRDRAIDALERCIRIEPGIPHLYVMLGNMQEEAGRLEEAERAYREALAVDPADRSAVESLTGMLERQDRLADAIPFLEGLAAEADAPEDVILALAEAYMRVDRPQDGVTVLETRRGNGHLSPEGELLLGRLYYESGRNEDAIGVFTPLYEHSGRNAELARILADLNLKTGDTEKARSYFEASIAAQPKDYRGYLSLFFAQSEQMMSGAPRIEMSPAEAGALLATASPLVPADDFDANYAIGMAYSSVDSLQSARLHLLRANEIRPGERGTLFNLAAVEEKTGNLEAALALLEELHGLVPEDAAVCNFYGYVLAELDRELDLAEKLVRTALEQDPENGYFIDSLGWVYYQRGDYRLAAEQLERALQILGEDPVILEHLGDAYSALARYQDALAAYRQSDSLQEKNLKLREKIESTERRLQ